ncbi:hypothetical protein F5144DRAFT_480694, partial [Chaetomium tenue]
PISNFLWLPADIVQYLFKEHQPPVAATALSLTCKTLFHFIFPTVAPNLKKDPSDRQDLQLLLEKDHGQAWWYCDGCSILHRIRRQGPTLEVLPFNIRRRLQIIWNRERLHHSRHWLEGTNFMLDYETVRLVMNRHFFGAPHGLPLDCFNVVVETCVWQPWRLFLPWVETWSARIIQDELFLSATRTINSSGWTDETFRTALNREFRQLCGHVRTASSLPYTVLNALCPPPSASGGFFAPCEAVVESCRQCFTDYTTTIERRREDPKQQKVKPWFITITSYHQLGSGRSATDIKFEVFGQWLPRAVGISVQDMVAYPVGAVKAAWDSYRPTDRTAMGDGHVVI